LPFTDPEGTPFGNIKHLVRGDDKSAVAFDIFRLKRVRRQYRGRNAAIQRH
jgi:hypothetical protein